MPCAACAMRPSAPAALRIVYVYCVYTIVYVYTQLDAGSSIAVLRREGEKKRRQKSIRTRLAPTARKRKRSHGPRAAFDPGSGGTPRRSGDVKAASPRQADADDPSINVVYTQYTIHIHNPARRPAPGFFAPRRRRENVVYTHKKAYNPPPPPAQPRRGSRAYAIPSGTARKSRRTPAARQTRRNAPQSAAARSRIKNPSAAARPLSAAFCGPTEGSAHGRRVCAPRIPAPAPRRRPAAGR